MVGCLGDALDHGWRRQAKVGIAELSARRMNDEAKNPRTRRRWQFRLRSLLLLVPLVALGLLACRHYVEPYWRQKQTVTLVEKLGGSCETVEVDHWWLRLLGST